ncbi:MAG: 4Fe-4S binding protein [Bacteroidales bacterium]|nr:4Fe-4S binding protein [Bacteroidales bacterium]
MATKVKGAIVIDTERCKGCEVCIPACPQKILALSKQVNSKGYFYVIVQNHEECTGCTNCAIVCPDGAIEVYRAKVEV